MRLGIRVCALFVFLWLGIALACFFSSPEAQATPAFARATKLQCYTCHFGGSSRLTAFGRDFYMRGHRTKLETWPGTQNLDLAKYVSIGGEFNFDSAPSGAPASSFSSDYEILAGGPLPDNFSFFVFSTLGADASVDTGYLSYTTDPSAAAYGFFRAGFIKPTLLKALGGDPAVSIDGPQILNAPVFANPADSTPNTSGLLDGATGLSAGYHTAGNWTGEVGAMNGPAGDGSTTQDTALYASLDKQFDRFGTTVGLFGYSGAFPAVAVSPYTDNFTRLIGLATVARGNSEATFAYGIGKDDTGSGGTRSPRGGSFEYAYNVTHNITPFLMYESFTPDAGLNYKTYTLGASFRLGKIGRVAIEGRQFSGSQSGNFLETYIQWLF